MPCVGSGKVTLEWPVATLTRWPRYFCLRRPQRHHLPCLLFCLPTHLMTLPVWDPGSRRESPLPGFRTVASARSPHQPPPTTGSYMRPKNLFSFPHKCALHPEPWTVCSHNDSSLPVYSAVLIPFLNLEHVPQRPRRAGAVDSGSLQDGKEYRFCARGCRMCRGEEQIQMFLRQQMRTLCSL